MKYDPNQPADPQLIKNVTTDEESAKEFFSRLKDIQGRSGADEEQGHSLFLETFNLRENLNSEKKKEIATNLLGISDVLTALEGPEHSLKSPDSDSMKTFISLLSNKLDSSLSTSSNETSDSAKKIVSGALREIEGEAKSQIHPLLVSAASLHVAMAIALLVILIQVGFSPVTCAILSGSLALVGIGIYAYAAFSREKPVIVGDDSADSMKSADSSMEEALRPSL